LALASLIAQLATPDVNSPLGAAVNAQILAAAASDPSIFNALLNSLSVPKSAASSSNQQQTALQRQFLGTPLSHLGVGNCSFPQQQQPQQGYAPSLTDSQHGLLNGTLDPSILAAMIQQQQRLNMVT
jgi:hypothetical protein